MEQTLGNRIAANRKRLGLTQDQLAEQLGVTPQAVSKWENNQSCPDIAILPKLAQIFGITTDELMGVKHETVHQAEIVSETTSESSGKDWEFRWDSGRRGSLGIAIWVLLTGVLLFVNNLLGWDGGLWDILWTGGLLIFGLFGLYPRFSFFRLGCALFGGGALVRELGILEIPLVKGMILPILLLLFGLSLLADAFKKPNHSTFHFTHDGIHGSGGKNTFEVYEDSFLCNVNFGDKHHAISLPSLSKGSASVCFGELTLDLTGCRKINPGCTLEISCSFGELELLVPRCCIVTHGIGTHFGELEIQGSPAPDASNTLFLNGSVSFGELTIKYI